MPNEAANIVNRLWNYCGVLRDEGVSYQDYIEQLTYLLFLKMAYERTQPPYNNDPIIPEEYNWEKLVEKEGDELEVQYRHTLENLGKGDGMLATIFKKSQNKIQDPAKLNRLINMIDDEEWLGMDIDVKGEIYEGLLQKNAEDTKSGAGQYFTPRPLINAIVDCIAPEPKETISDPACGTGGFFLGAYEYIKENYTLDKEEKGFLKYDTFHGKDIVDAVARLCVMNLSLHGIGDYESEPPIDIGDSLVSDPGERYDIVMTNPPFGKKSSVTVMNEKGEVSSKKLTYEREDFWATSSNKQLNFLQHVKTLLKINGRAGIVVPDNVLFEGGDGETVRKQLLQQFDVHTLLRLPTGIFYADGVKANVLFFQKKPAREEPWTKKLWVYDLRTNKHFTLKRDPLTYEDLKDFIECYNPKNRQDREESERFKAYTYEELMERNKVNLDITWLKDESLQDLENLPEPEVLANEIVEDLESALDQFRRVYEDLEDGE